MILKRESNEHWTKMCPFRNVKWAKIDWNVLFEGFGLIWWVSNWIVIYKYFSISSPLVPTFLAQPFQNGIYKVNKNQWHSNSKLVPVWKIYFVVFFQRFKANLNAIYSREMVRQQQKQYKPYFTQYYQNPSTSNSCRIVRQKWLKIELIEAWWKLNGSRNMTKSHEL